ncbi:hypothetical protein [Acinetobacter calcoaceticus]|uniref:hypothetical protein n=1 Tax=Acinetobacter calcoaceticus TaxID=471 RepID=UPI0005DB4F2E|nr:hypothetical protein [Acinetobacter calcoaceticus]KJH56955.1 hypothetical protein UF12_13715 [Acinetobacter calcoaceticus]
MKSGQHPKLEEKFAEFVVAYLKANNIHIDYVVRALGSSETQASAGAPLQRIGLLVAKELNAQFIPYILSKNLTTPMHQIAQRDQRQNNINNQYRAIRLNNQIIENKSILVIDDVVTTQSTALEIHRALATVCSNCTYTFLAFAKTEEIPSLNKQFFK